MAKAPANPPESLADDPDVPQSVRDPIPKEAAETEAAAAKAGAAAVQEEIASKPAGSLVITEADLQLLREKEMLAARLRADDKKRETLGTVTMICVSPFMLVEIPGDAGRLVQRGEELEVALIDVHAMTGRCRLKGDPLSPDALAGPVVTRGTAEG
jgi:hypothetical protein